jgi:hypothetical protein
MTYNEVLSEEDTCFHSSLDEWEDSLSLKVEPRWLRLLLLSLGFTYDPDSAAFLSSE